MEKKQRLLFIFEYKHYFNLERKQFDNPNNYMLRLHYNYITNNKNAFHRYLQLKEF